MRIRTHTLITCCLIVLREFSCVIVNEFKIYTLIQTEILAHALPAGLEEGTVEQILRAQATATNITCITCQSPIVDMRVNFAMVSEKCVSEIAKFKLF